MIRCQRYGRIFASCLRAMANDFIKAGKQLARVADQIEKEAPRLSILLANEFLFRLKRRVFYLGKSAGGDSIGQYSTKPMLVGSSTFTRYGSQVPGRAAVSAVFGSRRKRASRKWVTVNGHRLAVLSGGYKEFRRLLGRDTSKVNLNLTGDLFRAVVSGKTAKGAAVGMNSPGQIEKALGNEARFKKRIFEPSEEERTDAEEVLTDELLTIFRNAGFN